MSENICENTCPPKKIFITSYKNVKGTNYKIDIYKQIFVSLGRMGTRSLLTRMGNHIGKNWLPVKAALSFVPREILIRANFEFEKSSMMGRYLHLDIDCLAYKMQKIQRPVFFLHELGPEVLNRVPGCEFWLLGLNFTRRHIVLSTLNIDQRRV
jgi:hypothetical protein